MDAPSPPTPLQTGDAYLIHQPGEPTDQTRLQDAVRRVHTAAKGPLQSLHAYIRSPSFVELLGCMAWYYWASRVPHLWMNTTERPIQFINLDDGSILWDFRFAEEAGSKSWLGKHPGIKTVTIPMVFLVCLSILCRRYGEIHASLCVYYFSIGTTWMATNVLKKYVGYLRPDALESCEYNEYCEYEDARVSFPSGHSSMAFCGMTILSMYIHRHFGLPRHQLDFRKRYISILSLLPMGFAAMVACSRVVDNKHFPADVTAGAMIGAAIGYFCYDLWFFTDGGDLLDA